MMQLYEVTFFSDNYCITTMQIWHGYTDTLLHSHHQFDVNSYSINIDHKQERLLMRTQYGTTITIHVLGIENDNSVMKNLSQWKTRFMLRVFL